MATICQLAPSEHLAIVHRDHWSKNDLVYIITCRSRQWLIVGQSLPQLARWINSELSCGEAWDKVSVTGLFDCINRTDRKDGGFHKGRYRVQIVALERCADTVEAMRGDYKHTVVVAGVPGRYVTVGG